RIEADIARLGSWRHRETSPFDLDKTTIAFPAASGWAIQRRSILGRRDHYFPCRFFQSSSGRNGRVFWIGLSIEAELHLITGLNASPLHPDADAVPAIRGIR